MEIENIDKLANDYASIKCNNHFAYQTAVIHFKNGYEKAINDAIELVNLRCFELNFNSSNYHPARLEEISALIDQLKQLIK